MCVGQSKAMTKMTIECEGFEKMEDLVAQVVALTIRAEQNSKDIVDLRAQSASAESGLTSVQWGDIKESLRKAISSGFPCGNVDEQKGVAKAIDYIVGMLVRLPNGDLLLKEPTIKAAFDKINAPLQSGAPVPKKVYSDVFLGYSGVPKRVLKKENEKALFGAGSYKIVAYIAGGCDDQFFTISDKTYIQFCRVNGSNYMIISFPLSEPNSSQLTKYTSLKIEELEDATVSIANDPDHSYPLEMFKGRNLVYSQHNRDIAPGFLSEYFAANGLTD